MAPSGCDSSLSVVGVHSVGREWACLIWRSSGARDDPGDLLGQRVPPVLSLPGSVRTARPLGWPLGGLLRSCPPEPMFLVRGAISRLPCVALVSRMTLLVRGVLPRSSRRRPVTLASVMRWCAETTITMVRGGNVCGCPLPLCRGARMSSAVPLSGSPAG